jgi:hypothetical protein
MGNEVFYEASTLKMLVFAWIFDCVWYYGSFYGCGLEKNYFIKNIFSWSWFGIYICLIKTVVEIEVE